MAKKKTLADISEMGSVLDLVKSFDENVEIIAESATSNIKEWISSGNYILNACLSGSLFKGLPAGRLLALSGESQTGKSFLQVSFCREAQKMGYTPIILDSEGSIDAEFVRRLGVDPEKCLIKQVNTIAECSRFISNLCVSLFAQEEKYGEHQKVMLVIDSIGNLTSDKEREDTLNGNQKRDMTKQQELKALFRVNQTNIAKLGIPFICVLHTYAAIGSYIPGQTIAGGCLTPETCIITNKGLKTIKDIKIGDYVLSYDNEYHLVEDTWRFEKECYSFEFENGKNIECSENHRFLVNSEHPELESSWKFAKDLNESDEIYILE